jgi:hypothetical protein
MSHKLDPLPLFLITKHDRCINLSSLFQLSCLPRALALNIPTILDRQALIKTTILLRQKKLRRQSF